MGAGKRRKAAKVRQEGEILRPDGGGEVLGRDEWNGKRGEQT